MGSVFKKKFVPNLFPLVLRSSRKGGSVSLGGECEARLRTAPVTTSEDGTDRVLIESGTYVAKFEITPGLWRPDRLVAATNKPPSNS